MKKACLMALLLIGPATGLMVLSCIPPPPELQQARAQQAQEEAQRQARMKAVRETPPLNASLTLLEPGEIDRLEPELALPASAGFPMKILPFEKDAHYTRRLLRTFLESGGVDAGGVFARQTQSRGPGDLRTIDTKAMFGILEENGYQVYQVTAFELADALMLLKYELPFYVVLSQYCRTSATGEMGTLILAYRYSDYEPDNPAAGKIAYQGLQEFSLDLNKFADTARTLFVPVREGTSFKKVQKLWQAHRIKQAAGG